ncbi:unnamed protein product [Lactuca virosa]|uniref:Cytochrome b561 domain-containing protein n=1 Tax=Lactuca virosa TaxID=75947 RepID=A0AAU9PAV4_9ASTR|nr:unnamed protein product [Lactuca virosa]
MESFKAKTFTPILLVLVLVLLPCVICSSSQQHIKEDMLNDHHQVVESISPRLSLQIVIHGFLLWASMGFLIPVGILAIRLSNREENERRLRIMFSIHAVTQILSVILVTAGAILSVKNFSNTFDNMHRRIGVALYGLVLLQALTGLLRPARGGKGRSLWFFSHWALGTTISLLGIMSVYTGLHAYQKKTSRNIKPWVMFYTAEIVCIGFLYLLQEKWEYIQKQEVIPGNESTIVELSDNRETLSSSQNKDSC